jgi:hypothetical protein
VKAKSLLRSLTVTWVAVGLLGIAAVLSVVAWRFEAAAAADLARAREVQGREVPEGGGRPPTLDQYHDILATLERSVAIRREIDEVIAEIEDTIAGLGARQEEALGVVRGALGDIAAIGRDLDASVEAARTSGAELRSLERRLARTAALARAIAGELEELDRSFGPTVGGP